MGQLLTIPMIILTLNDFCGEQANFLMQIDKDKRFNQKKWSISLSIYGTCLWDDENGYYTSNQVLGRHGDFITSPEISQTFGELIGLWALSFTRNS